MSQTTVYVGGKADHVFDSGTGSSSPVPNNASQATQAADAKQASGDIAAKITAGMLPNNGSTAPNAPTPVPPATPANTPVNTSQPSPTTANATPYTAPINPAVSEAEAQANLKKGGLTGTDLAAAQGSLSAYQQAHGAATTGNIPAPQDAGTGMSAATKAAASAPQNYASPPEVQDAVAKATQRYTDDYAKYMSSSSQSETLVQQYQDLSKQLGIPALNTELMNMKNVIDGTEDDIRNEVTKASGFATDSQVLAMTNARNKTMIQNYNNLLQTKSDAMTQLTTLSGLAAQDRAFAASQIDKQLNFDQQQITFATNAQKNAQDSIQKSIDNYGAASVLKQALATGDPKAVSRINAMMGNGFDLQTAVAAGPTLDQQVKMASIATSKATAANLYSEIQARNNPSEGIKTLTGKPQNATQAVSNGFADRLGQANVTLNKIAGKFTSPLAIGGSLPTFLQSGDRQAYEQAKTNFVTAVLRQESGASIAPSEFKSAEATYFPVAGDTAANVAAKAATRNTVINNFYRQANVARPVFAGDTVQGNDGKQYKVGDDGVTLNPV